MKPEIVTLDGKPFVIMPLSDFESLTASAEEAEDVRIYDAAVARGGETFPDSLVGRLLDEENPILVFREHRGMTQQKLAKGAGISRAYLAAIETGAKTGSIKVLKAIAKALDLDLDMIV